MGNSLGLPCTGLLNPWCPAPQGIRCPGASDEITPLPREEIPCHSALGCSPSKAGGIQKRGGLWVLTSQRSLSHSHAGQLGAFQHSQMSQECAELGATSLLPSRHSSPPSTPRPALMPLAACSSLACVPPPSSGPLITRWEGLAPFCCPSSPWSLATVHPPTL